MTALAAQTTAWAPAYEVLIGGAGLAADISKSITDIRVTLSSDAIDQASVTLANPAPDLRFTHRSDARLFLEGNALAVRLGYVDDIRLLFDGEVSGSTPSFPDGGVPSVAVEASSRLHRLTAPPRSENHKDFTDGQLARRIADRNNLTADISEPPGAVKHPVAMQVNQDDLSFLRSRARATRHELTVEGRTLRFAPAGDGDPVRHTLVWGQPQHAFAPVAGGIAPLLRFLPRFNPRSAVTEVVVRGSDPLSGKAIVGRAGPSDAGPAAPGRTAAAAVARKAFGGDRSLVVSDQPVLTQQEADTLARALFRERSQQLVEASAAVVGTPGLRPGDSVDVAGVGPRFSGTYYVTGAVHTLGAGGYRTTLTLRCGDVGDLP